MFQYFNPGLAKVDARARPDAEKRALVRARKEEQV